MDKDDLKRYSDFVGEKLYDLLVVAQASAVYRQTSPTELTTGAPPEPPSPEPPQPPTTGPSIEIANAPIGGDPGEGPRGCAVVNWLGRKPIPEGTTIKLGSIHLEPKGIFELDQGSCSGDRRSCAGLEWKGGDLASTALPMDRLAGPASGRSAAASPRVLAGRSHRPPSRL